MFSETGATKSSVQPDCSDHTCCFVPYLDCHNSASLFPWDIHKWIYSGSDLSQTVKKCHIVIRLTVCESQAISPVFFCCVNHFSKHPAGSLCISGFQIIICKRHFTTAQMIQAASSGRRNTCFRPFDIILNQLMTNSRTPQMGIDVLNINAYAVIKTTKHPSSFL